MAALQFPQHYTGRHVRFWHKADIAAVLSNTDFGCKADIT
jgi:hypothetical protein